MSPSEEEEADELSESLEASELVVGSERLGLEVSLRAHPVSNNALKASEIIFSFMVFFILLENDDGIILYELVHKINMN